MSAAEKLTSGSQNAEHQAMSGGKAQEKTLFEQRIACRAKLAKQRQVIGFQLAPKLALTHEEVKAAKYPRSLTMRFLTQNPASAYKLILPIATMLIGGRALSALNGGVQIYKMFRASKNLL